MITNYEKIRCQTSLIEQSSTPKIKIFDRSKWIISDNKETRYKNMRDNLKEMNVLKAFKQEG